MRYNTWKRLGIQSVLSTYHILLLRKLFKATQILLTSSAGDSAPGHRLTRLLLCYQGKKCMCDSE